MCVGVIYIVWCGKLIRESVFIYLFIIDSSPPSAAYMRQWIGSGLVQIMACRLFGAKSLIINGLAPNAHYLNQCWVIGNWTLRNKLQWNFNQNKKLFIHENASENITCEIVAILSRGRWVKWIPPTQIFWHQPKDTWMLQWKLSSLWPGTNSTGAIIDH